MTRQALQERFRARPRKAIVEYENLQLSLLERAEANLNVAMLIRAGDVANAMPHLREAARTASKTPRTAPQRSMPSIACNHSSNTISRLPALGAAGDNRQ